jgi:hypothetical protein
MTFVSYEYHKGFTKASVNYDNLTLVLQSVAIIHMDHNVSNHQAVIMQTQKYIWKSENQTQRKV